MLALLGCTGAAPQAHTPCTTHPPNHGGPQESLFGRARVINQQGNGPEEIQISMDACPVSCIHWVSEGRGATAAPPAGRSLHTQQWLHPQAALHKHS